MAAPSQPAHSAHFLWQLQAIHLLVPRKLMPFTARTAAHNGYNKYPGMLRKSGQT